MKKLLTLLLAAAMTASFAGCTTTNANDQASSKGETASGEKKEITFLPTTCPLPPKRMRYRN